METFREECGKSCEREALGGERVVRAVGRAGVRERRRRKFIVFQSRRGLEADLSMRLELKEHLADVTSL